MTKAFEKIMDGMQDALAHAEGRADPASYRVTVPADVNVKAIEPIEREKAPSSSKSLG